MDKKIRRQRFLGELLIQPGVITAGHLDSSLKEQAGGGFSEKLGEVLIRLSFCQPDHGIHTLAKQIGSMRPDRDAS